MSVDDFFSLCAYDFLKSLGTLLDVCRFIVWVSFGIARDALRHPTHSLIVCQRLAFATFGMAPNQNAQFCKVNISLKIMHLGN